MMTTVSIHNDELTHGVLRIPLLGSTLPGIDIERYETKINTWMLQLWRAAHSEPLAPLAMPNCGARVFTSTAKRGSHSSHNCFRKTSPLKKQLLGGQSIATSSASVQHG